MKTAQASYNELSYYTLALRDPAFIHQHIVDAFAAQTADEHTRPIKLTFALAGLYLHVEKGFTGRQVQLRTCSWPGKKSSGRFSACPRSGHNDCCGCFGRTRRAPCAMQ